MGFLKDLLSVKADMNVQVDEKAWLGLPMKGTVTIDAREAFRVEVIVLQIRVVSHHMVMRNRKDPHGHVTRQSVDTEHVHYYQDLPISKSVEVAAGGNLEFPFRINIPVQTPNDPAATVYMIKAVANLKNRPDLSFEIKRTLVELTNARARDGEKDETLLPRASGSSQSGNYIDTYRCEACGFEARVPSERCDSCGSSKPLVFSGSKYIGGKSS